MCGIVGVAGNTQTKHLKVFREMLIFDQVRGFDSTGVVATTVNNTIDSDKDVGTPYDLWGWNMSEVFNHKGEARKIYKSMIGHNRAATVGKVIKENAHPFEFDNIIGVHNGSLRRYEDLHGYGKHLVDSMCLLETIGNLGIAETWKKFTGAASLVWWDKENNTLNMARNSERPMCFAWSKEKDVLFYASEAWMITAACARHGVELDKVEDAKEEGKFYTVFRTDVDHHYEFEVTPTNCNLIVKEKLEPKEEKVFHYPGFHGYSPKKEAEFKACVGWAIGQAKADKKLVGEEFLLEFGVKDSGMREGAYFCGKYPGEEKLKGEYSRIEVYPETEEEFEAIKACLAANPETVFKFKCRPRVLTNAGTFSINCREILGISSNNILIDGMGITDLVDALKDAEKIIKEEEEKEEKREYIGFMGKKFTKEEFDRELEKAGGQCCWCCDAIYPSDHKHTHWVDHQTIECEACHNISMNYQMGNC